VGVDVVIVNWNGGPELVAAVRSVERFGGRAIVVDNASSEQSSLDEVASSGVTVIRRATNGGFAVGCNAGIAAGLGDIVMLLNPDAEIVTGTAADLEQALTDSPAMVLAPRLENSDGQPIAPIRPSPRGRDLVTDILRVGAIRLRLTRTAYVARPGTGWIVGAALALRRSDWQRLGGLDEGYFLWYEDVDFGARIARAGGSLAITDALLVRHQGASTWGRLPRRRRQWLRVRGAWRYARHNLGWRAALAIALAAGPAYLIGVGLDAAYFLARR
jgi:N-acetylglucosaminyl-diphospho-decaprenol L-rhamnosyltransferase